MKKILVILLSIVICTGCVACNITDKNEIQYISRFKKEDK